MSKISSRKKKKKKLEKTRSYIYKIVSVNGTTNSINKVFYKGTNREEALKIYKHTLSVSNKVKYPKLVSKSGNVFTNYSAKLMFLKELTPNSTKINLLNDEWKIIFEEDYFEEEKFVVYGFDWRDKKTIDEVISLIKNVDTKNREIGVLNNKVIIYNEDFLDMITTKTREEGQRLGVTLYNRLKNNSKYMLRMNYSNLEKSELYNMLEEETGISRFMLKKRTS